MIIISRHKLPDQDYKFKIDVKIKQDYNDDKSDIHSDQRRDCLH